MELNSEEKWLGNWASAYLFGYIVYLDWYDLDGYPKPNPEWVEIRWREIKDRIESYQN